MRSLSLPDQPLSQPTQAPVPRKVLLPVCAALTLLAYYLVLVAHWAGYSRSGTALRTIFTDGVLVLAVYACLEVVRTDTATPVRAIAGALGFPLLAVTVWVLWQGLRRYVGV